MEWDWYNYAGTTDQCPGRFGVDTGLPQDSEQHTFNFAFGANVGGWMTGAGNARINGFSYLCFNFNDCLGK